MRISVVDNIYSAPKDAYSLEVTPAIVPVSCGADGTVLAATDIAVRPRLLCGGEPVSGFTVEVTPSSPASGCCAAVKLDADGYPVIHIYNRFMMWQKDADDGYLYTPAEYPNIKNGMLVFDDFGHNIGEVTDNGTVWIKVNQYVRCTGTNTVYAYMDCDKIVDFRVRYNGLCFDGQIQVVRNRKGEAGPRGPEGLKPIPVPAGVYSASKTYTADAYTTPFVLYDGKYYILNKQGSFSDINPKNDYAANGKKATWLYLESLQYVFAEILMANLALLGKAVFYGNYMYSQYGKNKDGSAVGSSGGYGAPAEAGGTFIPNLILDFLQGKIRCNDVDITGKVNAKSGTFTGEVNAKSGTFSGTIKAGLTYSSTYKILTSDCKLVGGTYKFTFDPSSQPCSLLSVHPAKNKVFEIRLPSPSAYDGMEIDIISILDYKYNADDAGNVGIAADSNVIKARYNTSMIQGQSGLVVVDDLNKVDWISADFFNLIPNTLYRLKSFESKWWVIQGPVT